MNSFWHDLPKPFSVLAPMEGVTDTVFRQIIQEIGRPDVFFTEFTSCAGLLSIGKERVVENLLFDKTQLPVIAQIFGTDPKEFYSVAKTIKKMGFSGIDINMGCPVRAVIKYGACSGLIKNPSLASEIIKATIEGSDGLPVSVKTRIGFQKEIVEEWIGFLLRHQLAALSVHLRTVPELSRVPAHWELMPQIISLRDRISPNTVIVGNGDINSLEEVDEKYKLYGADGYMVGTGIFANPWLFNKDIDVSMITIKERIDLFLHHIHLFEKQWGDTHNFAQLKKFAKTYLSNFPDSSAFRQRLMATHHMEELKSELQNYKKQI